LIKGGKSFDLAYYDVRYMYIYIEPRFQINDTKMNVISYYEGLYIYFPPLPTDNNRQRQQNKKCPKSKQKKKNF